MHNPRGSNNRLNEAKRERVNANRMFDSQNNNRGGYNVGGLYYISGSRLQIEWTNQHSCGNANANCDIIIQYMCNDSLRDGTVTGTIPEFAAQCEGGDCVADRKYGMHEDYAYFKRCTTRRRNGGLFVADQKLKGDTARFTRQNPNGQRRAYECPEERDYYPYWHASPWIDVAVLTNRVDRCTYYQANSQNVRSRWECRLPTGMLKYLPRRTSLPTDRASCEAFRLTLPISVVASANNGSRFVSGRWVEIAAHGVAPPECREVEWTRDNHLGNTLGGQMPSYNWTLPRDFAHESCALRLRYNISSADYVDWNSDLSRPETASLQLAKRHGFVNKTMAAARGYQWQQTPVVKPFAGVDLALQLAINTAQLGRVFQDRSHTFAIRRRPASLDATTPVHQLNVRGKRGNIVQVFPALEYDFTPNTVQLTAGDFLHVQWTGSNTNDRQLDGQGLAGTDRSNLLLLAERLFAEEGVAERQGKELGAWGRSYPQRYFANNRSLLDLPTSDLSRLALGSATPGAFLGDMSQLNDAAPYFDMGLRKVTRPGVFHTVCSRNNNFSNRSQKGRLICSLVRSEIFSLGGNGGQVGLQDASLSVTVAPGALPGLRKLQLSRVPLVEAQRLLRARGAPTPPGRDFASDFFLLESAHRGYSLGAQMKVIIKLNSEDNGNVALYRADPTTYSNWERVQVDAQQTTAKGRYLTFSTQIEGVYAARYNHPNWAWLIGLLVAVVLVTAVVTGSVVYLRRNPTMYHRLTARFRYLKRSTQSDV